MTVRCVTSPWTVQLHFIVDAGQGAEMGRQYHPDHGNVWTSTERTAGRSRTTAFQVSPASVEA